MPSHTRLRSFLKLSAAVIIAVSALSFGAQYAPLARATGIGPTLTLSGPGTLPPGGAFDLVLTSSGAVVDPYAGYNLAFTYDPTLVSFPSVTDNSAPSLWATSYCPPAQTNIDLGPILTPPPLKAYIYGCFSLSGSTSSVGPLATVHAQALTAGAMTFHMLTLGPPDNSSPDATYTFDASPDPQSNTLACSGSCSGANVVVAAPTTTGSISGKVYHDSIAPANALAGVVLSICPTGGGLCGSAYTDNTGAYKARFVADGPYNVTALPSNPFLTAGIGPVTVSGGVNTSGHDVVMPSAPGAISGHVYLNAPGPGNELVGTTVGACPTGGGECRTAVTDGAGLYSVIYLIDGTYDVTAVSPGINFQQPLGPIVVSGGMVSGQDIVVVAPGGGISGHVYANSISPANAITGAQVYACPTSAGPCRFATSVALGAYVVNFLSDGIYTLVAYFPGAFLPTTITSVAVTGGVVTGGHDIVGLPPVPPPPSDTITPLIATLAGVPTVNWNDPLTLTKVGCAGGTASYQVVRETGAVLASGPMPEAPAGTYTAAIAPFFPNHDAAGITITLDCGGGPISNSWTIYIDPSGFVKTQAGVPIVGATVTLLRSDSPFGPFNVVPNGSDIMSPMNRVNPDKTDATGHFGWDVTAGYYRVRASKPGCISAADPGVQVLTWRAFATTGVLEIPPPVFDIDLRLICDDTDQDGYTNKVEIVRGDHPTIYCQTMRSDIDDDGVVSILDFSKAAAFFGQSTSTTAPPRYDQGPPPFDGSISILDFSKMASVFQKAVNDCP